MFVLIKCEDLELVSSREWAGRQQAITITRFMMVM